MQNNYIRKRPYSFPLAVRLFIAIIARVEEDCPTLNSFTWGFEYDGMGFVESLSIEYARGTEHRSISLAFKPIRRGIEKNGYINTKTIIVTNLIHIL